MARRISMADIKRRYQPGPGAHWFERSTRRFFNDRLPEGGWEGPRGVYFAHSIRMDERHPRIYKVVRLTGPGNIDTVGGPGYAGDDFGSMANADAAAKNMADGVFGEARHRTPHAKGRAAKLTVAQEKRRRSAQAKSQTRSHGRFS